MSDPRLEGIERAGDLNEEERERRAAEQEAQKYDPTRTWSLWPNRGREGHYDHGELPEDGR